MRPPVLKLINRGNAFAKSFAGDTTFAAMLTAMRRDDDREHRDRDHDRRRELADELHRIPDRLPVDNRRRAGDHHAHRRKQRHRGGQRDHLTDDLLALAAAEPREVGHVQRQRGPEADHRRQRRHEDRPELAEGVKPARLREQRPEAVGSGDGPPQQRPGHDEHERRRPVLHRAQEIHPAIDDVNVQTPEHQKRHPLRRRMTGEAGAEQRRPRRG